MTKQQFEHFKKWFYEYVAAFYGSDELSNENIKLKEDHTRRMCDNVLEIAEEFKLNQEQKLIAQTIVLFHDVGRFEQFRKYRTYNDVGTENHSLLGLKILTDNKILENLDRKEREIIETAIRFHGEKELPAGLIDETAFFAKLIRDIDKLDIYYVMISRLDDFLKYPEKAAATLGLSKQNKYSEPIVQAVLKNRSISYEDLKTLNDMIIAMLGWIADINFVPTLKEIKKRKLFEQIIVFLPDVKETHKIAEHVLKRLDERILKG